MSTHALYYEMIDRNFPSEYNKFLLPYLSVPFVPTKMPSPPSPPHPPIRQRESKTIETNLK